MKFHVLLELGFPIPVLNGFPRNPGYFYNFQESREYPGIKKICKLFIKYHHYTPSDTTLSKDSWCVIQKKHKRIYKTYSLDITVSTYARLRVSNISPKGKNI